MWFLVFASLLVLCSGEYRPTICMLRPDHVCPINELLIEEEPWDDESLTRICPQVINFIDCIGNHEERCHAKLLIPPADYQAVKNVLVEICDENSTIHQEISEAMPCIQQVLKGRIGGTCTQSKASLLNLYEKYTTFQATTQNRTVDWQEENLRRQCLGGLYDLHCLANYTLNECGNRARDGFLGFYQRSNMLYIICPQNRLAGILDIIAELKAIVQPLYFTGLRFLN